jgi:hypothetical protein
VPFVFTGGRDPISLERRASEVGRTYLGGLPWPSPDDQRQIGSYYSRWLDYKQTNNQRKVMEKRMYKGTTFIPNSGTADPRTDAKQAGVAVPMRHRSCSSSA